MSVNVNTTTNTVTIQDANKTISIVDNENANIVNVPQPITSIIQVATPGPQGPQGPAGSGGGGGTVDTGSLTPTASFNAFTSSINTWTGSYNTGSFSGSFTGSFNGTATTASYYQETDPVFTAVSGTFVLTSSFNNFTSSINTWTSSYNTGSFSGSFIGTSSWAESASQAISSSYSLSSSYALSASHALTASYVNPLYQDVIITGSIYLATSSIYFSGSGEASRLIWNDVDGTLELGLKGGVVKSELGQGLVTRVVNKTSPLIDLASGSYQVVVIGGAQGQRLSVRLAQANNDANSAGTLGVVAEDIARNQEGFVITVGLLKNRDTTGALQSETWNDGDILYLSPTVAGQITNIKPQAPNHTVIIGYVEYAHQNNGKIYIKIDNGYEIDELHNVKITTASLTTGDLLVYSSSVWINTKQLTGSYGLTGSLTATSFTGSLFGTSSWAQSASNAINAQTASFLPIGTYNITSSWAANASQSLTASSADSFTVRGNLIVSGATTIGDGTTDTITLNAATMSLGSGTGILNIDSNTLYVDGNTNRIGIRQIPTATFDISGSTLITGSLSVNEGITGSLFGTSSWAESASQAITASYITGSIFDSNNLVLSASHANQADSADSATNSTNVFVNSGIPGTLYFAGASSPGAINSLYADTNVYINPDSTVTAPGFTGSLEGTASWAANNVLKFTDGITENSIDINTEVFLIEGTTDQITTTSGNSNITIGFPTDVVFPNNVTIQGDLAVDGQTTFTGKVTIVTSSNLTVDARYIGISAKTDVPIDSGIIVVTASGSTPPSASGYALYLDSLTSPRWALSSSVNLSASGITPDEYLVSVKTTGSILSSSAPAPTYGGSSYGGGNIIIDNNNDIWIYIQ